MTSVMMRKPWRPSTKLKKCMLERKRSLVLLESCYHTHHWQLWEKLELKNRSSRRQFLGVWLVVLERSKGLYVLTGGSSILHGDSTNNIWVWLTVDEINLWPPVKMLTHAIKCACEVALLDWDYCRYCIFSVQWF